MRRNGIAGIALAIALIFGAGWLARTLTWHPDPRLVAAADSLERAVVVTDSLRHAAARADSLADARAAELQARVAALQRRAAVLGQAGAHLTDTIRVLVTDSATLAVLERLGAAHAAEVAALDSARGDAEERADVYRKRLTFAVDTLVPDLISQRDRARALLARAIAASRPRHGWKTDAALLVGGVAAGYLLRR